MNLFRPTLALIALLSCCLTGPLTAQTPRPQRPQADRWLLIVDTSAAMKPRGEAVLGVVGDLLGSGMNGQMQPGAEFSIWTYNKELYAGVAPKQTWMPANSNTIVRRTLGFLNAQEFRSKAQLQPVMDGLARAVGVSRHITVVWLSDGSQKISGTPFDEAINAAFATNKAALAKARMPLVTVLRGHNGAYFAHSVSVGPWPVEFPPFPVEPKTNAVTPVTATTNKPVEVGQPIFMSGPKKTEAEHPAPVEPRGGTIKLRPPPESESPSPAIAPAQPVEPVQPLPLANITPSEPVAPPVIAPAQPAPLAKSTTPAPATNRVDVAAAPAPSGPSATNAALSPIPSAPTAPSGSSPVSVSPTPLAASAPAAPETVTARKWPLILGIGFMWVAIIVALVLARRARRTNTSSLITRSLEHERTGGK